MAIRNIYFRKVDCRQVCVYFENLEQIKKSWDLFNGMFAILEKMLVKGRCDLREIKAEEISRSCPSSD